MQMLISTIIDGLNLGSVYALVALGYSMVYGIAKMLNFAHGDVIMVGIYSIFVCLNANVLPVPVTMLICVAVCALLGFVVEKLAYKPLRSSSSLSVLITAIGVSYLLQNVALLIFKSDRKFLQSFIELGSLKLGEIEIPLISFVIWGTTLIIMFALDIFIKKTSMGRAMLAVSEDKGAAQLMGVNVNRTISLTFIIGSALAGVAAILYAAKYQNVDPYTGSVFGIKAFAAAVFGGIGSIPGAMIGGVLLGVIETVVTASGASAYKDLAAFVILILVLLIRPCGILGKNVREKV